MFRLNLFGSFSLSDSGGVEIALASKKSRALLAYIAQSREHRRSREEIMALLWSDRAEAQARASLRQVLAGLRKQLGESLLEIDREGVGLNAANIEVIPSNGAELLSGFHLSDPAFEEWLRDERLRMEAACEAKAWEVAENHPDKPYIAVLPFANLSGDPDQQYFADGITEDITTALSRFRKFWVISRSSSFSYQSQGHASGDAGRELGVNYLVEGSVRKAGNRVRVSAQLTDISTDAHIWADRYDRDLEDIFAVQDEVVTSVVAKLDLSLTDIATTRAKNRRVKNLRAYDLLLRARYAWWRGDDNAAFEFARKSVEADPSYAAAHAYFALQNAYQFYSRTLDITLEEIAKNCRAHAESALKLDDTDPVVHAYAGMAFGCSPLAEKERGRKHANIAISLNPNDCEIMLLYAWLLTFDGRPDDALEMLDKTASLNPLGGFMNSECYLDTYYSLGEYEKALDCYKDQADAPHQAMAVFVACYAQLGRKEELAKCLAEIERIKPKTFDLIEFARAQILTYAREEDKDNFRQGYRLAGLDV